MLHFDIYVSLITSNQEELHLHEGTIQPLYNECQDRIQILYYIGVLLFIVHRNSFGDIRYRPLLCTITYVRLYREF